MADDQKKVTLKYTGQQAGNTTYSILGGVPLSQAYSFGANETNRQQEVNEEDAKRLLDLGLFEQVSTDAQPTDEEQQQNTEDSAALNFLMRLGLTQDESQKVYDVGITSPDALKAADDKALTDAGLDKVGIRKVRGSVGK